MIDMKELIINALHYYDSNKLKYDKIIDKATYFSYILHKGETEHNTIIFYDKNKKEIFKSRYEVVGQYFPKLNVWIWGWGLPIPKNLSHKSKKLFDYAFDLAPADNLPELKLDLMTPRILTDNIQLDIHVALASYISKIKFIYRFIEGEEDIESDKQYKILKKIDEDSTQYYSYIFLYLLDFDDFKLDQDSISVDQSD